MDTGRPAPPDAVVLYDGVCHLCQGSVRFIVERDPRAYFRFAQLQSPRGRALLAHHRLPADIRTIVLVEQGTVHVRSGAALRIARRLAGPWRLAALFLVVPAFVRDAVYDWVARHRYAWFGRSDACEMPSGAVRERLLDGGAGGAAYPRT
jgi:predicted DCC family thiol-disulfide oxidoreductase YuxK